MPTNNGCGLLTVKPRSPAAAIRYEGKIWDVKTSRLKATFPMLLTYSRIPFDWEFNNRDELSVHPRLPIVMAANDKFIRFWSTDNGELIQRLDSTGGPAQWSSDGTLLLTFGKKRKVAHVWRVVLPFQASLWPSLSNWANCCSSARLRSETAQ